MSGNNRYKIYLISCLILWNKFYLVQHLEHYNIMIKKKMSKYKIYNIKYKI